MQIQKSHIEDNIFDRLADRHDGEVVDSDLLSMLVQAERKEEEEMAKIKKVGG